MNIANFIFRTYLNSFKNADTSCLTYSVLSRIGESPALGEFDSEHPILLAARKLVELRRGGSGNSDEKKYFSDWTVISKEDIAEIVKVLEDVVKKDSEDSYNHYNLDFVANMFDADEIERRAINVALLMKYKLQSGKRLSEFLDRVLPGTVASHFEVQRLAYGFSYSDIDHLAVSGVVTNGLLVPNAGDEYYTICDSLGDILQIKNLDVEYLKNKLYKTDIVSTLEVESYAHMEREIKIVESIVNSSLANRSKGTNIFLWGTPGTGKTELPLALAKKNGWNVITVGDFAKASSDNEKSRSDRLLNLKLAQRVFSKNDNVVFLFDEFEDVANEDKKNSKAYINRLLESTEIPIFWTTNYIHNVDQASLRRMTYNIRFKLPTVETRLKIWKSYAQKYNLDLDASYLESLSEKHEMSPSLIHNTAKIISSPDIVRDDIPHIIESVITLVNYGESPNKQHFRPFAIDTYSSRFVNANIDVETLTEKIVKAKKDFSLCLYGPPGTGKSEYAKYLAHILGKKILYKTAANMTSMWKGETEKLIAAAFEQAEEEKKILLIDEGDSFLRNRLLAGQQHEITQVNEMLSQMERKRCTFILSTNLIENLDAAALRRFTFKIKYDFLKSEQNADIFQHYFGVEAPEGISKLEMLTPGDFAAVKDKAEIMEENDAKVLFEMLREEVDIKDPHKKNKIGFN